MVRTRAGAITLGCLVWLMVIAAAVYFGSGIAETYIKYRKYQDAMAHELRYRAKIPDWQLRTRGMHDSFAFWGGVEQVDRGQPWLFGGRIGFETSAVTPGRATPLTIAPPSATLDLGVQFRLGSWIAQLSYGLQYFQPVSVSGSDFDPRYNSDCIASENDYSTPACAAVRNGYAIASADGDYSRMLHAIRLGFRYALP